VGGAKDGRWKIASFNANGITARLPNLLRWLAETRPAVACLQELKVPHDKFPEAAICEAGMIFTRFYGETRNQQTGWWSEVDLNIRDPSIHHLVFQLARGFRYRRGPAK
jgi:exonuclease III